MRTVVPVKRRSIAPVRGLRRTASRSVATVISGPLSRTRAWAPTRPETGRATSSIDRCRASPWPGDPLAGFRSQRPMSEETSECPPLARAWNAGGTGGDPWTVMVGAIRRTRRPRRTAGQADAVKSSRFSANNAARRSRTPHGVQTVKGFRALSGSSPCASPVTFGETGFSRDTPCSRSASLPGAAGVSMANENPTFVTNENPTVLA